MRPTVNSCVAGEVGGQAMWRPKALTRRSFLKWTAAGSALPWFVGAIPATAASAKVVGVVAKHPVGRTKLYTSVSPAVFVTRTASNSWTAFNTVCTHEGGKLSLQGTQAVCPLHGAVFNARNGKPISGPVSRGLRSYKVSARNGKIYVTI